MKEVLDQIIYDLQYVKVASCLMLESMLLLMVGLIRPSKGLIKGIFACTILLGIYFNLGVSFEGSVLSSSLFVNESTQQFSFIFLVSGLLLLVFNRSGKHATEFYFLLLSILIGSIFLMTANSLLVSFLALELTSFGSYMLTSFSFKKKGFEASIKYLIFGAVSSAMMLLGLGILYGTVDSFFIHQWEASSFDELHPVVGLGLMLFGLFFKASVFPFHIWVPATYQSAPNDVAAFISIVPKLASLLLLKRVLAIFPATHFITELCLGFGLLTMAVGTFAALRQSNARRMISLGAIAHSGFLLPLAIIPTTSSEASLFWYTTVYMFMNFGIFYLIDFFESNEVYLLGGYASLGKKFPVIGVSLTILCISLVGLPPVAGFTAKFLFFTTLWEQYVTAHSSILMLYLVVSVLLTVVSLFFYLKIPYQLFLVKEQTSQSINPTISTKIIATLFSIVMLLLFFVPHLVMNLQRLINYTFL